MGLIRTVLDFLSGNSTERALLGISDSISTVKQHFNNTEQNIEKLNVEEFDDFKKLVNSRAQLEEYITQLNNIHFHTKERKKDLSPTDPNLNTIINQQKSISNTKTEINECYKTLTDRINAEITRNITKYTDSVAHIDGANSTTTLTNLQRLSDKLQKIKDVAVAENDDERIRIKDRLDSQQALITLSNIKNKTGEAFEPISAEEIQRVTQPVISEKQLDDLSNLPTVDELKRRAQQIPVEPDESRSNSNNAERLPTLHSTHLPIETETTDLTNNISPEQEPYITTNEEPTVPTSTATNESPNFMQKQSPSDQALKDVASLFGEATKKVAARALLGVSENASLEDIIKATNTKMLSTRDRKQRSDVTNAFTLLKDTIPATTKPTIKVREEIPVNNSTTEGSNQPQAPTAIAQEQASSEEEQIHHHEAQSPASTIGTGATENEQEAEQSAINLTTQSKEINESARTILESKAPSTENPIIEATKKLDIPILPIQNAKITTKLTDSQVTPTIDPKKVPFAEKQAELKNSYTTAKKALTEAIDLPDEDLTKLETIRTKLAAFQSAVKTSNSPTQNDKRTIRHVESLLRAGEKILLQKQKKEQQETAAKQEQLEQKKAEIRANVTAARAAQQETTQAQQATHVLASTSNALEAQLAAQSSLNATNQQEKTTVEELDSQKLTAIDPTNNLKTLLQTQLDLLKALQRTPTAELPKNLNIFSTTLESVKKNDAAKTIRKEDRLLIITEANNIIKTAKEIAENITKPTKKNFNNEDYKIACAASDAAQSAAKIIMAIHSTRSDYNKTENAAIIKAVNTIRQGLDSQEKYQRVTKPRITLTIPTPIGTDATESEQEAEQSAINLTTQSKEINESARTILEPALSQSEIGENDSNARIDQLKKVIDSTENSINESTKKSDIPIFPIQNTEVNTLQQHKEEDITAATQRKELNKQSSIHNSKQTDDNMSDKQDLSETIPMSQDEDNINAPPTIIEDEVKNYECKLEEYIKRPLTENELYELAQRLITLHWAQAAQKIVDEIQLQRKISAAQSNLLGLPDFEATAKEQAELCRLAITENILEHSAEETSKSEQAQEQSNKTYSGQQKIYELAVKQILLLKMADIVIDLTEKYKNAQSIQSALLEIATDDIKYLTQEMESKEKYISEDENEEVEDLLEFLEYEYDIISKTDFKDRIAEETAPLAQKAKDTIPVDNSTTEGPNQQQAPTAIAQNAEVNTLQQQSVTPEAEVHAIQETLINQQHKEEDLTAATQREELNKQSPTIHNSEQTSDNKSEKHSLRTIRLELAYKINDMTGNEKENAQTLHEEISTLLDTLVKKGSIIDKEQEQEQKINNLISKAQNLIDTLNKKKITSPKNNETANKIESKKSEEHLTKTTNRPEQKQTDSTIEVNASEASNTTQGQMTNAIEDTSSILSQPTPIDSPQNKEKVDAAIKILGLDSSSQLTENDIRRACNIVLLNVHPDKNISDNKQAHEATIRALYARDILLDSIAREKLSENIVTTSYIMSNQDPQRNNNNSEVNASEASNTTQGEPQTAPAQGQMTNGIEDTSSILSQPIPIDSPQNKEAAQPDANLEAIREILAFKDMNQKSVDTATRILKLSPSELTVEAISKAYREISLRIHPDKNMNNKELAKEATQLVNNAKDVLKEYIEKKPVANIVTTSYIMPNQDPQRNNNNSEVNASEASNTTQGEPQTAPAQGQMTNGIEDTSSILSQPIPIDSPQNKEAAQPDANLEAIREITDAHSSVSEVKKKYESTSKANNSSQISGSPLSEKEIKSSNDEIAKINKIVQKDHYIYLPPDFKVEDFDNTEVLKKRTQKLTMNAFTPSDGVTSLESSGTYLALDKIDVSKSKHYLYTVSHTDADKKNTESKGLFVLSVQHAVPSNERKASEVNTHIKVENICPPKNLAKNMKMDMRSEASPAAQVNYYMQMASSFLIAAQNGADAPSKEKPYVIKGKDAKEVEMLWTACMILINDPEVKKIRDLNADCFRVQRSTFNPPKFEDITQEQSGWFGKGYNQKFAYGNTFMKEKELTQNCVDYFKIATNTLNKEQNQTSGIKSLKDRLQEQKAAANTGVTSSTATSSTEPKEETSNLFNLTMTRR